MLFPIPSARASDDSHELQRKLLEAEGVEFDEKGRLDLRRFRWDASRSLGSLRKRERPGR